MDEEGEQTGQHAQVCTGCSDLAGAQDAAQDENKTREHRGLLQLTAALLDHPPTTTTLQGSTNPRVTPFVTAWVQHPHFGSNILILVPISSFWSHPL